MPDFEGYEPWNYRSNKNFVKIKIGDLLKQSKPQKHLAELFIEALNSNPAVCVIKTLRAYLMKNKNLRTNSSLFITQKTYFRQLQKYCCWMVKTGDEVSRN